MHIAISGNIGAGKTTLARLLSEHYGWETQYEAVEGNPYLPPFYSDMEKWAFHLQIYFLNSRFQQALLIQGQTEKTIIQDRSIYEDAFIFAQNLYDSKILNETDFATYKGLFDTITQTIHPPDLMIYLKADLSKLQKQIKIRNRDYEQSIDPAYLLQLNDLYTSFTAKYTYGRIIEIDVTNMNFLENKSDFQYIINLLETTINLGTQLKI